MTSQELKQLRYGLWCQAVKEGLIENITLYDKLTSMIDNYCEHDGYAKCRHCGINFRSINE